MPESMISEAHASLYHALRYFLHVARTSRIKFNAHFSIATMKQEIPYSSAQLLYYAWQLSRNRGGADDDKLTGVLSEARVDLNPHQVMAALFAFQSPFSKGVILADEVGLGKR